VGPEYKDPAAPPDQVRVDAWPAGGGYERVWYNPFSWAVKSSFIIEKRTFNRFADDEVPSQDKRREVQSPTGLTREASKDGKCWTEAQVDVFVYITRHFIKKQWVEYWRIDETLEEYYAIVRDVGQAAVDLAAHAADAVESAKAAGQSAGLRATAPGSAPPSVPGVIATVAAGAAAVGPALAADAAITTEGLVVGVGMGAGVATEATAVLGSAVYAAGTAGTALGSAVVTVTGQVVVPAVLQVILPAVALTGAAVAPFVTTTRLMEQKVKSAKKESEGWELVGPFDAPEDFEKSYAKWVPGPVRDCVPPSEEHWTTPLPPPEEHWTTPLPPPPPEEHWTTPQPKPISGVDWSRRSWLIAILLIGALALVGGRLVLSGGNTGTGAAATPPGPAGSGPAASSPATSTANPTPGPVGLGWTGTTADLTFTNLKIGQCAASINPSAIPPQFGGGWSMATQPGAGNDVALNMLGLPTSPFAPALNGSIAPDGVLHVAGDSTIESMDLTLNIPSVPGGPLPAPINVTGSAQVGLHSTGGDCATTWDVSGTLTPPGAATATPSTAPVTPSPTATAPFTVSLLLNYGHSASTTSVCLTLQSTPAQAGAPVTATIKGPGVVGAAQISSTLLPDGSRHGHFSVDKYGTYSVTSTVTSNGVAQETTQTIDVTAAPGQGQCP
jgi:hypothetical protein